MSLMTLCIYFKVVCVCASFNVLHSSTSSSSFFLLFAFCILCSSLSLNVWYCWGRDLLEWTVKLWLGDLCVLVASIVGWLGELFRRFWDFSIYMSLSGGFQFPLRQIFLSPALGFSTLAVGVLGACLGKGAGRSSHHSGGRLSWNTPLLIQNLTPTFNYSWSSRVWNLLGTFLQRVEHSSPEGVREM